MRYIAFLLMQVRSAAARTALQHDAKILEIQFSLDLMALPRQDRDTAVLELLCSVLDDVVAEGHHVAAAILDHVTSFPPIILPVKEMTAVLRQV